MGYILLFIGIIVVAFIVHKSVDEPEILATKTLKEEDSRNYISDNMVHIGVEYRYESEFYKNNINWYKGVAYRYIVDDRNKSVHIMDKEGVGQAIPFREIIGCEIITDSEVTGGIGRAIVGGVLAGEAGAVVGAVTAKKHIMSYKIVIYRANIQEPTNEILLISEKKSTKDADYINAVTFANKVNASIKAIISTK